MGPKANKSDLEKQVNHDGMEANNRYVSIRFRHVCIIIGYFGINVNIVFYASNNLRRYLRMIDLNANGKYSRLGDLFRQNEAFPLLT